MRIFNLFFGMYFFLCFSSFSLLAQKKTKEVAFHKQLKEIKTTLSGVYEIRETDEKLPASARIPQDIIMIPIWELSDELWIYGAWLNPDLKERPMEENMWRIRADKNQPGKILFDLYRIPDPQNYQYEWRKNTPYADLSPQIFIDNHPPCHGQFNFLPNQVIQGAGIEPCFRNKEEKLTSYVSGLVDFKFSEQGITQGHKFFNSKGETIMQFNHEVLAKKTKLKVKNY
jgi:hypothetical protein